MKAKSVSWFKGKPNSRTISRLVSAAVAQGRFPAFVAAWLDRSLESGNFSFSMLEDDARKAGRWINADAYGEMVSRYGREIADGIESDVFMDEANSEVVKVARGCLYHEDVGEWLGAVAAFGFIFPESAYRLEYVGRTWMDGNSGHPRDVIVLRQKAFAKNGARGCPSFTSVAEYMLAKGFALKRDGEGLTAKSRFEKVFGEGRIEIGDLGERNCYYAGVGGDERLVAVDAEVRICGRIGDKEWESWNVEGNRNEVDGMA